jgi:hypothetical protein
MGWVIDWAIALASAAEDKAALVHWVWNYDISWSKVG